MIMIFIGASVAGYEDIIATRPLCFNCVYESIGKTVAIGVIPVFGLTILNRYRLLRKHLEEAKEMHDRLLLDRGKSQPQTVKLIQLSSSNKGENFEADLDDILFISALGNYVEVHHLKYGELTKTILRSTLSSLIEQLTEYHQIHQCHRAYLVNLNNVKDVVGNAGGYELSFGFEGPVVPVSKRKTAEFRRLMSGK